MPIDPSMVKWDDAPASAPAIDPRMVKWQDVPQPTQPMSRMDKVLTGVADPIQGGAQLLTHMLPSGVVQAGNDLNNWLADKTGLVARLPAGGVDQQTKEREAAYQAQRAAAGESGFDGYRMIGNVVSPANLTIAGKGMQLANGAKVLGGALGGGASALMNPVYGNDYASEKGKQVAIGTAMGGVGALVLSAANVAINSTKNLFNNTVGRLTPQQLDARIASVLQDQGINYNELSRTAQATLRKQLADALNTKQSLDPAAVRRMADFAAVGATPTRGMLSLDPVQITREQNLSRMAANSSDGSLSGLPLLQNRNNNALIGSLNKLGADRGVDATEAGRTLMGSITAHRDALRTAEQSAWDAAKSSPGYTQPIFKTPLSNMNAALGEQGMMPFMNPKISAYIDAFQTGAQPFTPQAYRNLQSMLANEISKGGNEGAAARIARQALENSPMQPITNPNGVALGNMPVTQEVAAAMRAHDAQPGNAISAIDAARRATRDAYAFERSNPVVRAALSDSADPTRLANRFIFGRSVDDARMVAQQLGPEGMATVRDSLIAEIKNKALGGASDEVGKISQSNLNKAINSIGDEKLRLFFTPQEISQLKSTGRAASYMQVQPVGSAVGNSNTGAVVGAMAYDALNGIAKRVPFGKAAIIDPMQQLRIDMATRQATNLQPGLLMINPQQPRFAPGLLAPAAATMGGLLAQQLVDQPKDEQSP